MRDLVMLFAFVSYRGAVAEVHEGGDFGLGFLLGLLFWFIEKWTFGGHFFEEVFGVEALVGVDFTIFSLLLLWVMGVVFGFVVWRVWHGNKAGKF